MKKGTFFELTQGYFLLGGINSLIINVEPLVQFSKSKGQIHGSGLIINLRH